MKEKKAKPTKSRGLFAKISKFTDLSVTSHGACRIEISEEKNGYKAVFIYNVKKIEKYTDTLIVLLAHSERIIFEGNSLECITYASDAMEISGVITSIGFDMKGNGRNV